MLSTVGSQPRTLAAKRHDQMCLLDNNWGQREGEGDRKANLHPVLAPLRWGLGARASQSRLHRGLQPGLWGPWSCEVDVFCSECNVSGWVVLELWVPAATVTVSADKASADLCVSSCPAELGEGNRLQSRWPLQRIPAGHWQAGLILNTVPRAPPFSRSGAAYLTVPSILWNRKCFQSSKCAVPACHFRNKGSPEPCPGPGSSVPHPRLRSSSRLVLTLTISAFTVVPWANESQSGSKTPRDMGSRRVCISRVCVSCHRQTCAVTLLPWL